MGLASAPRLLILDEPTQGLAESEIAAFKALIRALSAETTILLIEHNMSVVMELADEITVLNFGEILAHGTAAEIHANPDAVEDETGERYWLFRSGDGEHEDSGSQRWFLHGIFG